MFACYSDCSITAREVPGSSSFIDDVYQCHDGQNKGDDAGTAVSLQHPAQHSTEDALFQLQTCLHHLACQPTIQTAGKMQKNQNLENQTRPDIKRNETTARLDSTEFLLKCSRAIFPGRTRPYPEAAVPSVIQKSTQRDCFLHSDHEAARRKKQHIDEHIDHEGYVHYVSCESCSLQMRHHHPSPVTPEIKNFRASVKGVPIGSSQKRSRGLYLTPNMLHDSASHRTQAVRESLRWQERDCNSFPDAAGFEVSQKAAKEEKRKSCKKVLLKFVRL